LESVSGVDKATAIFETQTAKIKAHGPLCTSEEARHKLTYVLVQNRYGGSITTVKALH